jgi:hypothetical protein
MIRLAILYVGYSVKASYYDDWLDAFSTHPGVEAQALNLFDPVDRRRLPQILTGCDLAVILHSGTADTLDYVRKATPALSGRKCPLVVFMGNEFNMPWLPFADRRAWLREVGADFVATQLLEQTGIWLYEGSGARVIGVPHGLNAAAFRQTAPRGARSIDIGTRTFPYSIYVGNRLRNDLIESTRAIGSRLGLTIDIRTDSRLARAEWAAFLNDCRFTVATEAGSTWLERDDVRAFAIRAFLKERRRGLAINPTASIRGLARRLPWNLRQWMLRNLKRVGIAHEAIESDPTLQAEVIERFFGNGPSDNPSGTCISSRHFDAIGCRTVQILVEGRYNDILEPGRHYVCVDPDLGNLDDVLRRVADPGFANDVAERAWMHVMENHTLDHRVAGLLKRVLDS